VNFLAHCALGSGHPHHLVGGFLGDFIKGVVPAELPPHIQVGIRLHRRIDAYSARQDDIKTSVERLPARLRRVAPVFIDLVADHFLARHFEVIYGEPLATFAQHSYATLAKHVAYFPLSARRFFDFMRTYDMFGRYVRIDAVERAFGRIGERLGRTDIVAESMAALRADYDQYEADFLRYYPALREHADRWLVDAVAPIGAPTQPHAS
jgi:acyl carrier protein phosphodiesterase